MNYFTLQWWAGEVDDLASPIQAYQAYLASVKGSLPTDLRRLVEDVSLHDSRLRQLVLSPEKKELSIVLDGFGPDENAQSYHSVQIRLVYGGVTSFESLANPETGLGGPHGYGDLGYDEIDVLGSGLFQHRMLFSTGIEFAVTFADFTLSAQKSPAAKLAPGS